MELLTVSTLTGREKHPREHQGGGPRAGVPAP